MMAVTFLCWLSMLFVHLGSPEQILDIFKTPSRSEVNTQRLKKVQPQPWVKTCWAAPCWLPRACHRLRRLRPRIKSNLRTVAAEVLEFLELTSEFRFNIRLMPGGKLHYTVATASASKQFWMLRIGSRGLAMNLQPLHPMDQPSHYFSRYIEHMLWETRWSNKNNL